MRRKLLFLLLLSCTIYPPLLAQPTDLIEKAETWIDKAEGELKAMNQSIWRNPEVGLQEIHAAEVLTTFLEKNGFSLERGVAGIPTAFMATAGSGKPVIGFLAEYDALPGLSQDTIAKQQARPDAPSGGDNDIGHGCGHSIFGVGSVAGAVGTWRALQHSGLKGTIRLFGTPAEETGIGKVYMANAGLFNGLDAAFHWHPESKNSMLFSSSKALVSSKFRFEGEAAHASGSPERGRSALDAVELMNVGANYLREHLRDDVRLHYVITNGGGQPNVVPPEAEVWYYVRANDHAYVEYSFERLVEIAQGAAMMTRTKLNIDVDTDVYELLPNRPLSELLSRHFHRVGAPVFSEDDLLFAKQTQSSLSDIPSEPLSNVISQLPDEPGHIGISTDVGNVSWIVPTEGIWVASYTNGAPGHSWFVVACTGMSIGEKAMMVAAKILAGAALELITTPQELDLARQDFQERINSNKAPKSLIPKGQVPPIRIR